MGWADCGNDSKGRPIGYAFEATCDHPGCTTQIDRSLAYACGGMHGFGTLGGDSNIDWDSEEVACEGYFCEHHRRGADLEHEDGTELYSPELCFTCADKLDHEYRTNPDWRDKWPSDEPVVESRAQAIETRRAETEGLGAEHESAVGNADAPNPPTTIGGSSNDG